MPPAYALVVKAQRRHRIGLAEVAAAQLQRLAHGTAQLLIAAGPARQADGAGCGHSLVSLVTATQSSGFSPI